MSTNQTVSTSSPRYPIFLTSPHSVLTSRRGPPRCCVICTRLAAKGDVEPVRKSREFPQLAQGTEFDTYPGRRAILGPSSNWTGYDPFKIVMRDHGPPALPCARNRRRLRTGEP